MYLLGSFPLRYSIELGQPVILAAFFLILSIWAAMLSPKRNVLSGFFLALSFSLKPQLGLAFFLYHVIRKRWSIALSDMTIISLIFLVGFLRLGFNDFSWLEYWNNNLKAAFGPGGVNELNLLNPYALYLLNLQFLVQPITGDLALPNLAIFILISFELLIFYKFISIDDDCYNNLLELTFITIISLVATYHRSVDAIIIIIPLTLCIGWIGTQYERYALWGLLNISVFLVLSSKILLFSHHALIKFVNLKTGYLRICLMPFIEFLSFNLSILSIYFFYVIIRKNIWGHPYCDLTKYSKEN